MQRIKLDVNLKIGQKIFPAGVYNSPFPSELVAEIEADSRHISEIALPIIKKPRVARSTKKEEDAPAKKGANTANVRK